MINFSTSIIGSSARRSADKTSTALSEVSTRLSSGQRINSARDDAVGLGIAAKLNTNSRVFAKGIQNLNDGFSAINIAESALEQLQSITMRISELATQGANGSYSDTQRSGLQKEAEQLQAEWNRIVDSTEFNGEALLKGNNTFKSLQGGSGAEGAVGVQFGAQQLAGGVQGNAAGITRASRTSSGGEPNANTQTVDISADGRFVAYNSTATNIVSGDGNLSEDGFLFDSLNGTTTRVTTNSAGVEGNGSSQIRSISADGRYVAFISDATNLVSGDTNGQYDVFVKDTLSGITIRANTKADGSEVAGNFNSSAAISADGRYVVFDSFSNELVSGDTNGVFDVFRKDLSTGDVIRVSTDSSGIQGDYSSNGAAVSADGRYIAFSSGSTNLTSGSSGADSQTYLKDTLTGTTTKVSTTASGVEGTGYSQPVGISADGRFVAFQGEAFNLTTMMGGDVRNGFVKDTTTGVVTHVTTDSNGQGFYSYGTPTQLADISADGRYVLFSTSVSLTPDDSANGNNDAFIKDTYTGITTRVSYADNGADGNSDTSGIALSADGRRVALQSFASNFVDGDTSGFRDTFIFDRSRTGVQVLSGVVVSNSVSAKFTLDLISKYRSEIDQYRAQLGSSSSRVRTYKDFLGSQQTQTDAAKSRITDIDVAEDTSQLVALQIKQNGALAIQSQANQSPKLALSLLNTMLTSS